MPANSLIPPAGMTEEQWEQSAVVQADVLHVMKGLVSDGVDYRVVLAGASSAVADLVGNVLGWPQVPIHFAQMAALTHHLSKLR